MKRAALAILGLAFALFGSRAAFADACSERCYQQYLAQMRACATDNRACAAAVNERYQCQATCTAQPSQPRGGAIR
jgi:hypothetical protein